MVSAANNSGSSFLRELRRRNVARSAAIYIAICSVVLMLARSALPAFGIESAAGFQALLYTAVLGLPCLLVLAWHFQLTRRGVLRATSFVERRVLRNMAPINDRRHAVGSDIAASNTSAVSHRWLISAETGSLMGLTYGISGAITIGSAADCEISVVSDYVAPRHVRLVLAEGQLTLEDLSSATGTVVNGKPVQGQLQLQHEDELRLHDVVFRVTENTPGGSAEAMSAD